jgi:hypothetical protein
MTPTYALSNLMALVLLLPEFGRSQTPPQKTTLSVAGYPGRAPVIQVNGKSYVEIESLAASQTAPSAFRQIKSRSRWPPRLQSLRLPKRTSGLSCRKVLYRRGSKRWP